MAINSSADDYKRQLIKLSPQGRAWPIEDTSNWVKLLDAVAQELARIDAHASLLVNEAFPDTTLQLLENWERIAGIPDECSQLGDTIQVRRNNLKSKLTARGGQSRSYFVDVAAQLGFDVTITEFRPFQAGISSAGDAVYSIEWRYVWRINAPEQTVTYFRAGQSAAGEPLASWGNDRLECVINKLKPAHTNVLFGYSS